MPPARIAAEHTRPPKPEADSLFFRGCDRLSGILIYAMVVFSVWAFGTTEPWSMWTMNVASYALAVLFLVKLLSPGSARVSKHAPVSRARATLQAINWGVATLTVFVLGWCLVNAFNASASYSPRELQFVYRKHLEWLPHSMDADRSWVCFWNYLALGCAFWSVRAWLLGGAEPRAGGKRWRGLPGRLQTLLWLLSINGALVALEGLLQRLDNSGKLLWLVQPSTNPTAASQFGPYAYRSNAAQYLNLVWPVTLGFWAFLQCRYRRVEGRKPWHHFLLSCVMIMAACPLLSDSRAGAIMTAGLALGVSLLLSLALPDEPPLFRAFLGLFSIATLILGLNVGWQTLSVRMKTLDADYHLREDMYTTARKIVLDYPWLGTGPGTFDPIFQLYRTSPEEYWPGQLHNDWLETRITFGGIGMAAVLLSLGLVLARWPLPAGGIPSSWSFPAFFWLSLSGCLLHARFDFPFQIYSIVFLFVLFCAVLFALSRRSPESGPVAVQAP